MEKLAKVYSLNVYKFNKDIVSKSEAGKLAEFTEELTALAIKYHKPIDKSQAKLELVTDTKKVA